LTTTTQQQNMVTIWSLRLCHRISHFLRPSPRVWLTLW